MRLLSIIFIVLITCWTGYWWVASRTIENSVKNWFEKNQLSLNGTYSEIKTRGFPNRVDITVSNLMLDNLTYRISLTFNSIQFLNLIYSKNHSISVITPPIKIKVDENYLQIHGTSIKSSIEVDKSSHPIEFISEAPNLKVTDHNKELWIVKNFFLATKKNVPSEHRDYRVHIKFDNIRIPSSYLNFISKPSRADPLLTSFLFDSYIQLNKKKIEFSNFKIDITSNVSNLNLRGDLSYSTDEVLNGSLKFSLSNLQKVLSIIEENNQSHQLFNKKTQRALNFIFSQTINSKQATTIPIYFKNNAIYLGPLKVGNLNVKFLSTILKPNLNKSKL